MKLKTELAGVFKASGVTLERQFRGFDTDGDGAIDHDEFKNGLMSLGANVSEAQIDDLITILDKDGDGEIDYREFSLWFGAGPPPPPVLPQVKSMQDARSNSAVDSHALLREIEARGGSRGGVPPPPPPPPLGGLTGGGAARVDRGDFLQEISLKAGQVRASTCHLLYGNLSRAWFVSLPDGRLSRRDRGGAQRRRRRRPCAVPGGAHAAREHAPTGL